MYNNLIFVERFKQIRNVYGLSFGELARYCTIFNVCSINKSAFSYWETNKRTPSLDTITIVTKIFGVSIDWLVGDGNNAYTESKISVLEATKFPLKVKVSNIEVELPIEIPEDYINYELRKKTYTLETRANIIFLLYVLSYEWERYVGDNISEFTDKNVSELKLLSYKIFHYFMKSQSKRSKIEEYSKTLNNIFITKKPAYTLNLENK